MAMTMADDYYAAAAAGNLGGRGHPCARLRRPACVLRRRPGRRRGEARRAPHPHPRAWCRDRVSPVKSKVASAQRRPARRRLASGSMAEGVPCARSRRGVAEGRQELGRTSRERGHDAGCTSRRSSDGGGGWAGGGGLEEHQVEAEYQARSSAATVRARGCERSRRPYRWAAGLRRAPGNAWQRWQEQNPRA